MINFELGDLVKIVNTIHDVCKGTVGIVTEITPKIRENVYYQVNGINYNFLLGKEKSDIVDNFLVAGHFERANHGIVDSPEEIIEVLCKREEITKERLQILLIVDKL